MAPDTHPDDSRRGRGGEAWIALLFLASLASSIALVAVYWVGGQPQVEGTLLALGLGTLGSGLVLWAHRLLPQGPFEEPRTALQGTPAAEAALEADIDRGGVVSRRRLLIATLSAAVGGLVAVALFPIRSLGPRPGNALRHTPWRSGLLVVNEAGVPVRLGDVPVDGLVTVFPQGAVGSADGQAVLIRVEPGVLQPVVGRETWSPNDLIVYSKVCTHAGCPVGLYDAQSRQLLCPCHQSAFDVVNGAKPVFGPAARALPQLPITVTADGTVMATGDFSAPIGPGFWNL